MPFSLSLKAYSKIVLHCCKYPHKAVNGVVIGSISKKDQSVQIQDAIPLFHLGLGLAPMLEVALAQVQVVVLGHVPFKKGIWSQEVEVYCNAKGLSIVGYYHANERLDDSSLTDTALCIAAKIANISEKTCLLAVDNRTISNEEHLGLKLYTRVESGSHWKEQSAPSLIGGELALRTTGSLVENRLFEQLVDFDNHLDCIQLDWTNPAINRAIDTKD